MTAQKWVALRGRERLLMRVGKRTLIMVAAGVLALGTGAGALGASAGASVNHVARPHGRHVQGIRASTEPSGTPEPFTQQFGSAGSASSATSYADMFCNQSSGCDGAVNDYGTIDRVPSGFSNGGVGNYAPFTSALTGGWFAITSGSQDENQGQGCPELGTSEYCSGPFALFPVVNGGAGDNGNSNVFPSNGFTVTDDLYLDPATAPGPNDSAIDNDVELNAATESSSTGYYGNDNIIVACYETNADGMGDAGFVIQWGPGDTLCSPNAANDPAITTPGWYRFVWLFTPVDGRVFVSENVIDESTHDTIGTSGSFPFEFQGATSAEPVNLVGGPGYWWMPGLEASGVPLANFALQLGQEPSGHTP
jgi:hypothetical protein